MNNTESSRTVIELVSRYSPSGQESEAVNWLVGHMQELGYTKAFSDGAGNAVGIMGEGPKQIVLLGHIDTVPGEIEPRVEDGILYGRGSVDAKGPLSTFVDATAQLGAVDGWQIVVIGAVDEERESKGARFVTDQYNPDYFVIGEPNNWHRVGLGYKGIARFELNFTRSQAHSASSKQTASEAAIEAWQAIQAYAHAYNLDKKRAFDQIMLNLRGIHSKNEDFFQWAQLKVVTRLPVGISPEQWYKIVDEISSDDELVKQGFAVPAHSCEKNTPLVRAFLSNIRAQGGKPAFVYKSGTADLNTVGPYWQCPALVYGPGDSKLDHTLDERISLEEYQRAVTVLAGVLKQSTN